MLTILSICFWIGVVAGVFALLAFASARYFRVVPAPDSIVFVTTEDSWRITLTRYAPSAKVLPPGAPPVVLCPGGGLSGLIFDISKEISLPRFLAEHGYDVWVLDLRGRGHSFSSRLWGRPVWSFDDYVEFDVPAVLETVCRRTGAEQVQWIGFGLGAQVMFGALRGPEISRIRSLVAMAAPAFFKRLSPVSPGLLRRLRLVRLDHLTRLLGPLLGRLLPGPLKALQNKDNIEGSVYRRAMVNAVCGFSRTELLQYAEWLEHDTFTAIQHRRDFRADMATITVPTFFVIGPRDEIAPPDVMEATMGLLDEAEEKASLLASRMHGLSTNYGHLDLLIGRGAKRDIFTHLLGWLDRHAGVQIPEGRPRPPEPREGVEMSIEAPPPQPKQGQQRPERWERIGADDDEDGVIAGDVPRIPNL